uniref:Troponin T, slow skeletal muscle n=1 Tax=Oncorhynchus kisutch TaxID=8019 RepID=A0A8C7IP39_ONCKI
MFTLVCGNFALCACVTNRSKHLFLCSSSISLIFSHPFSSLSLSLSLSLSIYLRPMVPQLAPPKIPEGDRVDFVMPYNIKELKDLLELQSMIDVHFDQRKKEEEELIGLKDRIYLNLSNNNRKEDEEAKKKNDDEAKKKKVLSNMGANFGGFLQKGEASNGGREIKKKTLAERRPTLEIDTLREDALKSLLPPPTFSWSPRQRAQEMWNWIYTLESDKFDFIDHMKKQKYQVGRSGHVPKVHGKGKVGGRWK